jgi:hypothetical protein
LETLEALDEEVGRCEGAGDTKLRFKDLFDKRGSRTDGREGSPVDHVARCWRVGHCVGAEAGGGEALGERFDIDIDTVAPRGVAHVCVPSQPTGVDSNAGDAVGAPARNSSTSWWSVNPTRNSIPAIDATFHVDGSRATPRMTFVATYYWASRRTNYSGVLTVL